KASTTQPQWLGKRNEGGKVTTKRVAVVAFLTMACLALPTFAQQSKVVTKGPIVIKEFKHDTGPPLPEVAPLLPEFGTPSEHEIENDGREFSELADPELQRRIRRHRVWRQLFLQLHAPDNDGAPGTTQYVQYVNLTYEVFEVA